MMQKIKKRAPLFLVFAFLYLLSYILLDLYQKSRINDMLNEQEKYLEMSYKQGLDRFENIAQNIYITMQNDAKLINLIAQTDANNIDNKHDEIFEHLQEEFENFKLFGIMGIQITTPKNVSIIRMHAKERYGDDLSLIRPMLAKVNEETFQLHGFEEGKTSHAFRQIYPLFRDGVHIGAMEVLFSSTKLQDYTMKASDIHTHFIVDKKVFDVNEWESNIQEAYAQSIEHEEYLFNMNLHMQDTILENSKKTLIEPMREEINKGFETHENFSLYKLVNSDVKVLVFYAVQRFSDKKTVAYLVSYTDVNKLYKLIETMTMIKLGLLLFCLLVYFIATRLLNEKETVLNELKYDGLTKVYARKYFMDIASIESKKLKSKKENFCVVMADIDHFKKVNDTYGHPYGDLVLRDFAGLLKNSTRSADMVARYGGEEFVIILYTNAKNAHQILENIRSKVQEHTFGEKSIHVTASFGMTECRGESDLSFEELIQRADKALYEAKESGRNKIQVG